MTVCGKGSSQYIWIHTSMPGNGVTSDPVATRMFMVLTSSLEPSPFVTVTSLGAVIVPWPFREGEIHT